MDSLFVHHVVYTIGTIHYVPDGQWDLLRLSIKAAVVPERNPPREPEMLQELSAEQMRSRNKGSCCGRCMPGVGTLYAARSTEGRIDKDHSLSIRGDIGGIRSECFLQIYCMFYFNMTYF